MPLKEKQPYRAAALQENEYPEEQVRADLRVEKGTEGPRSGKKNGDRLTDRDIDDESDRSRTPAALIDAEMSDAHTAVNHLNIEDHVKEKKQHEFYRQKYGVHGIVAVKYARRAQRR